jgi:hypothetical protein
LIIEVPGSVKVVVRRELFAGEFGAKIETKKAIFHLDFDSFPYLQISSNETRLTRRSTYN